MRIAHGTYSAHDSFATSLTTATDADAGLGARHVGRAHVRRALSTREWIAHVTFDALTSRAVVADDALGTLAAHVSVAL